MLRLILSFFVALAVAACSGPKDTPVPKDLTAMEAVKPALEKLTTEERELFAGYVMRNTFGAKLGAMFGGKEGPGIPDGMTVGKAIEDDFNTHPILGRLDGIVEEGENLALLGAHRQKAKVANRLHVLGFHPAGKAQTICLAIVDIYGAFI